MKIYTLERTQQLKVTLDEAWDFFSSPENLDEITPGDMGFDIISKRPIPKMFEGQLIEYKVRPVLNIPMYWKTKIVEVNDRESFVDEQLKGPYKLWRHKHSFEPNEKGVLMRDRVDYALPLGIIGQIGHSIFVKKRLNDIFDFRYQKIEEIFS
ncbi:MAG: SRPBCC family protein [Saprospiraceae bacterium]|nr:SRPBCC family protein [Saprospiraceae bacterium]